MQLNFLLLKLGLRLTQLQVGNPSVAALYEDALVYETGTAITSSGALTAYSGAKTGRSPLDKRIVREPSSEGEIWWGPVNKPMEPEVRNSPVVALVGLVTCLHISAIGLENQPRTRHRLPEHQKQNLCRRWLCRLG